MSLAGTVVRVLANDDHFDAVEWGVFKGAEPLSGWGKDGGVLLFSLQQELSQLDHVGLLKLWEQRLLPALFQFDSVGSRHRLVVGGWCLFRDWFDHRGGEFLDATL